MVEPRLVYLSDSTEVGTVYTKAELVALRDYCDTHGLLLYLDGARLGSALTSPRKEIQMSQSPATFWVYPGVKILVLLIQQFLSPETIKPQQPVRLIKPVFPQQRRSSAGLYHPDVL